MGSTSSQITLEKVSTKNLIPGDHIIKRGLFRNQHGIYIDGIMGTCVCLDSQSGLITETHITNFCSNQNKLYRAKYNNDIIKQSNDQIIANAKRFVAREYFSVCCLSTSFNFCFNCSTNRYTTAKYPAVPTLTISHIKELQKKIDVDNAGDINNTKQYETQPQISIKESPSKSIVKIEPNNIKTANNNNHEDKFLSVNDNNITDNNNDNNIDDTEQEIIEQHKNDPLCNNINDDNIIGENGVIPKRLLNLINMSKEIKKFEPQNNLKSQDDMHMHDMDPSIELEHITVPLPFVNENKLQNQNSPSRSIISESDSIVSTNDSDMCIIIDPEMTSSNSDEFVPVILK